MKLKCHRATLASALQVVSGVVPARTPKDILKNVKLQVHEGQATLIGTDQEVGIRYTIPEIEADASGETLLPTARVISILRELEDSAVGLELSGDAVWVRGGHSEFRLQAEDPAEFPPVAAFDDETYYVVSAGALRQMIRRTAFATDVESTRYALGGVLVEFKDGQATLAATDSRRLAVVRSPCSAQGLQSEAVSPVVPAKAMTLIERSLADEAAEVHLAVHPNDVLVRCGNSTIYSRLVDGRFPKYRDVIPQESRITIDLLVGPFYSAVRQAQIVTDEDSRGVDFTFAGGTLRLASQSADVGQSTIEIPVPYDGDELTITFDPRFVADFLRVLEPETQVQLKLIDSESAAVLLTDDGYTYVIMPLSRER